MRSNGKQGGTRGASWAKGKQDGIRRSNGIQVAREARGKGVSKGRRGVKLGERGANAALRDMGEQERESMREQGRAMGSKGVQADQGETKESKLSKDKQGDKIVHEEPMESNGEK